MSLRSPLFHAMKPPMQRALARAELRRRGRHISPPEESMWADVLAFATLDALSRMEDVLQADLAAGAGTEDELSADARGAMAELLAGARARMDASRAEGYRTRLPDDPEPASDELLAQADRLLAELNA